MKLRYSPTSPYVRKVLVAAIETGLDKQAFMRRLEDAIETASDRLIAEFSGRPYAASQLVLRSQGQAGIGQPLSAPRAAP